MPYEEYNSYKGLQLGEQDILGGKEARIDWCQSSIVTTGSKQHRTVYSIERGESTKK